MVSIEDKGAERRRGQARNVVLIALVIAFCSAMLGVVFVIMPGGGTAPDAWLIGLLALLSGCLMIVMVLKPAMATSVVTGALTLYFIIHLNAGAIIVFQASGDFVRILPYVTWFFPLVAFHQFTNFNYYKRPISVLVNLSPIPTAAWVLAHPAQPVATATLDAVVTFCFSFFAFVVCFGYFTRHREEEIERAARAEEADRSAAVLRVSDERFRMLGLATNDLIQDADLRTGRTWWSESLLDTYGYDPREAGDDPYAWTRWIHPDDHDRVAGSLQSVIESGGSNWSSEHRFICADGRTLNVIARGLVLRDASGEPIRLIGSMTDVTELRDLEKKLRHAQKMEAVGQLTGGIAHDFNNLLTIIVGSAETLADMHAKDPESHALGSGALQAAERGAELTSRLLSFARLQALAPEHRHPGELLAGIEKLIRRTIDEDIEIDIRVAADVQPIEVDPGQLENAVLNLVINARDAMPDGGRLTIEASNVTLSAEDPASHEGMEAGRFVLIAVSDNGTGMSQEILERAFEPFFTSKAVGKGSGLGLSMVWGFVRQSNGHALIYSEPREGTTVRLYFPAAAAADRKPDIDTPVAAARLETGTERILVVEDDALVRRHVAAQLGGLGYEIREAATAAEALAIIDAGWPVDLLFTDVVMPGGTNGRQLADAAMLRQPGLRVLFTSGYTENAIVHQGRLDPGVNLLGKPYRRADLVAKVRAVLDA